MSAGDRRIFFSRNRFLRAAGAGLGTLAFVRVPAGAAAPVMANVSAEDALSRLVAGNARFVADQRQERGPVADLRVTIAKKQTPFATVLCCSDSRVVPELAFDQTVGDLFVVRNAGNFVNESVFGTIEYGVANLGTELVVVLGHDSCGAISATYDAIKDQHPLPPHLDVIENAIRPGILPIVLANGSKDEATVANERAQVRRLTTLSSVLQDAVERRAIRVVAATYFLRSGEVKFET